ncbi:Uncharacterized protein GBIM_03816 [Gryllus bimaculatus]|nr:Uncharacterized protein GBIM_03816 [Gryllus bimaculatus]
MEFSFPNKLCSHAIYLNIQTLYLTKVNEPGRRQGVMVSPRRTETTLAALCGGSVLGWTAPVLPYLQGNAPEPGGESPGNASTWVGPQRPLTDDEASWVGALTPLGALLGALPAGWAADRLGRRRLLLALGALMTASSPPRAG